MALCLEPSAPTLRCASGQPNARARGAGGSGLKHAAGSRGGQALRTRADPVYGAYIIIKYLRHWTADAVMKYTKAVPQKAKVVVPTRYWWYILDENTSSGRTQGPRPAPRGAYHGYLKSHGKNKLHHAKKKVIYSTTRVLKVKPSSRARAARRTIV